MTLFKSHVRSAAYISLVAFLTGCGEPDIWEAFVYPDGSDLSEHQVAGQFHTFQECQEAAISWLRINGVAHIGDYECGLNCEYNSTYGMNVCEITKK